MGTKWFAKGEYMEACSCDFLCPCITKNSTIPATYDFCKVALAFEIEDGRHGEVPLVGVKFALITQSKAIMADGDWIGGLVIDASASREQAGAIVSMTSAEGGSPLSRVAPLITDFRGIERREIAFERVGRKRAVKIEGLLEQDIEGVPSVSVPGECVVIDNAAHPVTARLNLATASVNAIHAFGIDWDGETFRTNGHFASFDWRGESM